MTVTLTVELPKNIEAALQEAGLTREQLHQEMKRYVAMGLFRRQVLTLGQAADLASMSLWDFIPFLGEHGVPVAVYDEEDIAQELATIEWLRHGQR